MFEAFFYLSAFLLLLGVLVVVHEFGHFIVARWCGVKVLRFSVGFGRVLWRRRVCKDRMELTVCALPLGGYVRMLDEREVEEGETIAPEELPRAFNRQGVGRRSAIVAAGPLMNLLLAVLIYWLLFMAGSEALRPVLGDALPDSPAAEAGVANGDLVRLVDGEAVTTQEDFHWRLLRQASAAHGQGTVVLTVEDAQGATRARPLPVGKLAASGWEGDPYAHLGLRLYQPPIAPVLGEIEAGSPGEAAGLRSDDRVLTVDGEAIRHWPHLVEIIRRSGGKPLSLVVDRAGQEIRLVATPEDREGNGRLGVGVAEREVEKIDFSALRVKVRYGFFESAGRAVAETWSKSIFSLVMMGRMVTGEVSWKNISGPLMIADYAGKSASAGLSAYLKFMALVSISLGILNLLPIPVLDGGHLMYHALELIKGSPVSERFMMRGQQIGLTLLLSLMAFAFYNDLSRLLNVFFNG
ncbi:MAG: RIP metalloprotease RseP [Zoogloeaceae bacterium]|jgi:regulator of sigma E protease|nr:RIP metalloprotease RseP [Zoogloeaceae bacterium]